MNDQDRGNWTSASNALPDSLCIGRHLTQLDVSEVEVNRDSESGTKIHWALCHRNPNKLTLEEFSTYERCCEIEEAKVNEFFGTVKQPISFREQRFWIALDRYKHSAQPDVVYRSGRQALIIEYKSLFGDIEPAERNLQLRDQVVCVDHEFFMLERVGSVVIQPHVTMKPEITVYHPEDIERARLLLAVRIANSNTPEFKNNHNPGKVQCRYCRGKTICKEYNLWAGKDLPIQHKLLDVPVAEWKPEDMALFLDRYSIAENWLKDCKQYIKGLIKEHPGQVPGWTMRPGTIDRPVPGDNIQALYERFEKVGGDLTSFMKCLELGKGKFATTVSELSGLKGKALDESLAALYKDLTVEKPKDGSLVKIKG